MNFPDRVSLQNYHWPVCRSLVPISTVSKWKSPPIWCPRTKIPTCLVSPDHNSHLFSVPPPQIPPVLCPRTIIPTCFVSPHHWQREERVSTLLLKKTWRKISKGGRRSTYWALFHDSLSAMQVLRKLLAEQENKSYFFLHVIIELKSWKWEKSTWLGE